MFLSVPTTYDDTYLDSLIALNIKANRVRINEIYGSINDAPVGTIRPSSTLPKFDFDHFTKHLSRAHAQGIKFNYVMNSTVLDGSEYTVEGRNEIVQFVQKLLTAGVDSFTVTVPFIIRLLKEHFPNIVIMGSICSEIDSIQRASQYKELGVTSIVPAKDCNRNFTLLKNFVKTFPDVSFKLLATTPCLFRCSDIFYHMNLSSIRDNKLQSILPLQKFISHTAPRCQLKKLEQLVENIKSPWIRPEDLYIYSQIGIKNFKIDGRDKPSEYNLEVITAYMNEKYDGNLLYLMQNYYPKNKAEFENEEKLGVYIDNQSMSQFIIPFSQEKLNCDAGCNSCHYCDSWVTKAMSIYDKTVSEYIDVLKEENQARTSIK